MIVNLTRIMSPSSSGSSSVPVDNRVRKIIKHPLARQKFNVFLQPPRKLAASLTMSEEVPSAWDSRTFEKLHSGDRRVNHVCQRLCPKIAPAVCQVRHCMQSRSRCSGAYEETFIRAAEQARPGEGWKAIVKTYLRPEFCEPRAWVSAGGACARISASR